METISNKRKRQRLISKSVDQLLKHLNDLSKENTIETVDHLEDATQRCFFSENAVPCTSITDVKPTQPLLNSETDSNNSECVHMWMIMMTMKINLILVQTLVVAQTLKVQNEYTQNDYREGLKCWAIEFGISHAAVDALLDLHQKHKIGGLPKSARTLLNTRRSIPVNVMGSGEYCHFGLCHGLEHALSSFGSDQSSEIMLAFNIDGLPLFKSSSIQFWPILAAIFDQKKGLKGHLFVVGAFCGQGKPPLEDYLSKTISELETLSKTGLKFQDKDFKLSLNGPFIMDSPARSFVKCTVGHTGYSSCNKCTVRGDWDNNRVTFLDISSPLRTDGSFKSYAYESHHLRGKVSPLLKLDIGMVTQFPLEYLHLICLGVVKRLLNFWVSEGPFGVKLSGKSMSDLSAYLLDCAEFTPSEFCRRPGALNELARWKATEFRQFLLYTSMVALNDILDPEVLKHDRWFQASIYILASEEFHKSHCDFANSLLLQFVDHCSDFYGKKFIVSNVHGLIHLAEDVKRYGKLDNFSAFSFENELQHLKKRIRSPNKPLQQLARRLSESPILCKSNSTKQPKISEILVSQANLSLDLQMCNLKGKSFKKLSMSGFTLSYSKRDSFCILKSGETIQVKNIVKDESGTIHVVGFKLKNDGDIFSEPFNSSIIGIHKVSVRNNAPLLSFEAKQIKNKLYVLPRAKSIFAAVPLLHGYN